jgi:hypothetical protein
LGCIVGFLDLGEVVIFIAEKLIDLLHSVEEVEVLAVLIRLEIQRVKQLHKSLVKLREFDIARTSFNLPLNNRDLSILLSLQLPLLIEFLALVVVLGVDLHQCRVRVVFFYLLLALFGLLQFLVQALFLFSALAFKG